MPHLSFVSCEDALLIAGCGAGASTASSPCLQRASRGGAAVRTDVPKNAPSRPTTPNNRIFITNLRQSKDHPRGARADAWLVKKTAAVGVAVFGDSLVRASVGTYSTVNARPWGDVGRGSQRRSLGRFAHNEGGSPTSCKSFEQAARITDQTPEEHRSCAGAQKIEQNAKAKASAAGAGRFRRS